MMHENYDVMVRSMEYLEDHTTKFTLQISPNNGGGEVYFITDTGSMDSKLFSEEMIRRNHLMITIQTDDTYEGDDYI